MSIFSLIHFHINVCLIFIINFRNFVYKVCLQSLYKNGNELAEEKNLIVPVHHHGHPDVTCKPSIQLEEGRGGVMNPRDFHLTLAEIWQAFALSKFRIFGSYSSFEQSI